MQHTLVTGTHSDRVDLVQRQFGDVIQLNKIGISQHILFVLDVVLLWRVEGGPNGWSVAKGDWFSELSTGFGVLIELCHFYNLNLYTNDVLKFCLIYLANWFFLTLIDFLSTSTIVKLTPYLNSFKIINLFEPTEKLSKLMIFILIFST